MGRGVAHHRFMVWYDVARYMGPEKIRERLDESGVDAADYVRALRAVRGERPDDEDGRRA